MDNHTEKSGHINADAIDKFTMDELQAFLIKTQGDLETIDTQLAMSKKDKSKQEWRGRAVYAKNAILRNLRYAKARLGRMVQEKRHYAALRLVVEDYLENYEPEFTTVEEGVIHYLRKVENEN